MTRDIITWHVTLLRDRGHAERGAEHLGLCHLDHGPQLPPVLVWMSINWCWEQWELMWGFIIVYCRYLQDLNKTDPCFWGISLHLSTLNLNFSEFSTYLHLNNNFPSSWCKFPGWWFWIDNTFIASNHRFCEVGSFLVFPAQFIFRYISKNF